MRDNWLSNLVFQSDEQIITSCCEAWNKLIDQPWNLAYPVITHTHYM